MGTTKTPVSWINEGVNLGLLTQLVECRAHNARVVGSSPTRTTQHTNSGTRIADGGLSKIQFRTAGSRMLESVFI